MGLWRVYEEGEGGGGRSLYLLASVDARTKEGEDRFDE